LKKNFKKKGDKRRKKPLEKKIYSNFIGMGKSYRKRRGGSPLRPQGNNNSQNANTISGEDIVTEQQEYMTAEPVTPRPPVTPRQQEYMTAEPKNTNATTRKYQDQVDGRPWGYQTFSEEEKDAYHKKMQEDNLKAYRARYGRKGEFKRIYDENDEDNDDDEYPDQFDGGRRRKTTKRRKSTKRRKTMKRRKTTKRRKN